MKLRKIAAAAFLATVAQSQTVREASTRVTPLPEETLLRPCEYHLLIPAPDRPVRAVWVIYDRGPDFFRWYHDTEVAKFSAEFGVADVLALHCRSKEREDMDIRPENGIGRALFTALDQFAVSEKRPELSRVPLIHMGWSGAGALAARMAAYHPERYLAGIDYVPGQYDPLGMDTIDLPEAGWRAPQLIVANGEDPVNGTKRPYDYFRRYFDRGAPWTFAVQNRTPHCCLQNAQELILMWLRGVLGAKPDDRGKGLFGHLTAEQTAVVDEWKQPTWNVRDAEVDRQRQAERPGDLPAGWMPSRAFGLVWKRFEARRAPPKIWRS